LFIFLPFSLFGCYSINICGGCCSQCTRQRSTVTKDDLL